MTDNDVQTRPAPHQAATVPNPQVENDRPRADHLPGTEPAGSAPPPAAPAASYQVVGAGRVGIFDAGPAGPAGAGRTVGEADRKLTMMDRIRTPIAAAVGGGILILGVGFGAGFAVGHGMGAGQGATQTGPGGQGFGGPGQGGGFGGPGGGQLGQTGQGQTGQGQTGTGAAAGASTDTSFAA